MAKKTVPAGTEPAPVAQPLPRRDVLFEPFEWYSEDAANTPVSGLVAMRFAGLVRDVAGGTKTILKIIERDAVDDGLEDGAGHELPRLLDIADTAALTRLCSSSLALLAEAADRLIQRANTTAGEYQRIQKPAAEPA